MEVLLLFALLVVVGLVAGQANEQKHYRELAAHERQLADIQVSNERLRHDLASFSGDLVVGSVVIAEDYFKRVAASLRSLVGGNIGSYETLLERGRREAIVRMKQEARRRGATRIVNVRLETASLSADWSGNRPMFSAELVAYGTALTPR